MRVAVVRLAITPDGQQKLQKRAKISCRRLFGGGIKNAVERRTLAGVYKAAFWTDGELRRVGL
jgi:hypothetical protein